MKYMSIVVFDWKSIGLQKKNNYLQKPSGNKAKIIIYREVVNQSFFYPNLHKSRHQ